MTVASRIVEPSGARYENPRPARRRVIPGLASVDHRRPASAAASRLVSGSWVMGRSPGL